MNVSNEAFARVQQILDDDNEIPTNACLRVYIVGGGCSGFQYGFKLDTTIDEEDFIIEQGDVKVLVDPMSIMYLGGATLDFVAGLQGEMFVVNNPNATTTCGCGSSFSI